MTMPFSDAVTGSKIETDIIAERVIAIATLPSGQERAANILSLLDSMMSKRMDLAELWLRLPEKVSKEAGLLKEALLDTTPLVEMGKDADNLYHYPVNRNKLGETSDFRTARDAWITTLQKVTAFAISGAFERSP
jgi:hypothetical protein